jgi:hypothetical protein
VAPAFGCPWMSSLNTPDEVVDPVAGHVRGDEGPAEPVPGLGRVPQTGCVLGQLSFGGRGEARPGPVQDRDRAGIGSRPVLEWRSHDEVGEAVAVEVRGGEGRTDEVARPARRRDSRPASCWGSLVSICREAGSRSVQNLGDAGVVHAATSSRGSPSARSAKPSPLKSGGHRSVRRGIDGSRPRRFVLRGRGRCVGRGAAPHESRCDDHGAVRRIRGPRYVASRMRARRAVARWLFESRVSRGARAGPGVRRAARAPPARCRVTVEGSAPPGPGRAARR